VLSYNNLSGSIPSQISADFQVVAMPVASFVQHHGTLDLSWNHLSGSIPVEISDCAVLVELMLAGNELTNAIPPELARLTNLTTLDLSCNQLSGSIPAELGQSQHLQGLNLAYNNLTGSIPAALGGMMSLVELNLTGNRLSGSIPEQLGNLTGLSHMDFSDNELSGEIPAFLSNLVSVVGLYLQGNRLNGSIVGLLSDSTAWHQMQMLNLSHNLLSGAIPSTIGNLSGLSYLDVRGNALDGAIPLELATLNQLLYLDLSANLLSGVFPPDLCKLLLLNYLNISDNMLSGPVPNTGICLNFSASYFSGNPGLCGSAVGSQCPPAASKEPGSSSNFVAPLSRGAVLGIVLGCMIAGLSVVFVGLRLRMLQKREEEEAKDLEKAKLNMVIEKARACMELSRMSKEPLSINVAMFEQPLLRRLTLADVLQATNGFCKTNIIGDGGFGTVYKAVLPDGQIVAIKKLGHARSQGTREFLAEMETLGKVKHKNLVPLLGYCSFGEEKLLIYEYQVKGSLDLWLRNRADAIEVLDWPKRFKIAMGSARGLCFLHHGFIPHIIHRDMKASNILLDAEFEPRVADFGLARLISAYETHVSTDIAGTFGYIPPEYGQTWRSTTRGDVYSYGVILLELLTGKEPTGSDFKDQVSSLVEVDNLVGWVRHMILKGEALDVLDAQVATQAPWRLDMLKLLHIANLCTTEDPARRPNMLQVVKFLKDIKDSSSYLQDSSPQHSSAHHHLQQDSSHHFKEDSAYDLKFNPQ
jgi:hypothetical protein